MIVTSKGIVLHHFKYSEKSVIAKIYTEEYGLLAFIINGVRSAKSKNKAVYLQPLSLVEINFQLKEKKGLLQLKNITLANPYTSIPFNIGKSSIAFFVAEVLYKIIREEETNKNLYEFLFNSFLLLDLKTDYVNFHLVFMAQLCKYIGITPQNSLQNIDTCYFDLQEGIFMETTPNHNVFVDAESSYLLNKIFCSSLNDTSLSLTNNNRKLLLKVFLDYYHLHLSNFDNLKSLAVLEEVLN